MSSLTPLRVLYLDFDGVAHPDSAYWHRKRGVYLHGPGTLFMHAPVLIEALAPYPDVKLVLSTTWVRMLSFSRARRFLPQSLRDRVIGATWHSQFKHDPYMKYWWEDASRFDTVLGDVLRRRPDSWAAVDDDVAGWPDRFAPNLVACSPSLGLGDPTTQARLRAVLADLNTPGRLPMPLPFDYALPGISL